jgi:hypothetical protein
LYTTANGVTIVGYTDYPSRMSSQASDFYSKNLVNLLTDMCAHAEGTKTVFQEPMAKGFWVNAEVCLSFFLFFWEGGGQSFLLISHLLVPINLFFVERFKPILLSTKQTNNLVV